MRNGWFDFSQIFNAFQSKRTGRSIDRCVLKNDEETNDTMYSFVRLRRDARRVRYSTLDNVTTLKTNARPNQTKQTKSNQTKRPVVASRPRLR